MKTTLAAIAVVSLLAATAAYARPKYATKEGKACTYCHVKAGSSDLNPRGNYYAEHNLSFAGYDETKVMGGGAEAKKSGPPAFVSTWKMDLPGSVSRIGVGDVAGDKTPRLVTLEGAVISVYGLVDKDLKPEAKIELKTAPKNFAVGNFAKGKPAVIAVPGAIIYRDGDKYVTKAAPDLVDITGQVKFADGNASVFSFDGVNQPGSYAVDLSAANPITEGNQLVMPAEASGVYRVVVAHPSKEAFGMLMIPEEASKSGVFALLDARSDGKLYGIAPWVTADETTIVAVPIESLGSPGAKPVWKSAKVTGKVLDLAYGLDPKGSKKPGLFVLTSTGTDDKGRSLEFLALD